MSRLTICADDFAMSEHISRAIVELAHDGKVNAISCMAVASRWASDAALLRNLPNQVQVGLHLVLTGEAPLTSASSLAPNGRLPTSAKLTRKAFLNRLPLADLKSEIEAQFDRFEQVLGRHPSFVDGHQHTHLLPTIRTIVIATTARRSPQAWLRTCDDSLPRILRRPFAIKAATNAIWSAGFAKQARQAGLRCNDGFSGLYDFKTAYDKLLPKFLRRLGDQHLLICHPANRPDQRDPIADARIGEWAALKAIPAGQLSLGRW